LHKASEVIQVPGEAVKAVDHKGIAVTNIIEEGGQLRTVGTFSRSFVDEELVCLDAF
jgi:hypothetical protein